MQASERIDNQIAEFTDWRGEVFKRLRSIVHDAVPGITEEWKWNTAVWNQDGLVCAVMPSKGWINFYFYSGAAVDDPDNLFNASLEGKQSRAIKFRENDTINEAALKALIKRAAAYNRAKQQGSKPG